MSTLRSRLAVLAAFVLVTAIVTFPQVTRMRTAVADHPDSYFSAWGLGWVAHQLRSDPVHLFAANIFHPEESTLAYSDAILLPATVVAPLFWMHLRPALIYNIVLLGALALSGFTMFLLALELTGNRGAAFVAGLVYAFAPYRMEQYNHLAMETVFFIPLALLLIHRLLAGERVRDAVLLGLVMAAQFLSGLYGAMCFVVCLAVLMPLLLVAVRPSRPLRFLLLLIVGAAVAGVILLPYAMPYMRAQAFAGPRSVHEIQHYDAVWTNYLSAPAMNRLWGWTASRFGGEELNLFPGALAVVCALLGVAYRRSRVAVAYAGMLLFAFEASRGFDGFSYPLLYEYVKPFQALRVPSRFDLLVNLALGLLAAFGIASIATRIIAPWRRMVVGLVIVGIIAEYASAPALADAPLPSAADRWLATEAPGVLVELPLPTPENMWPNSESRFMFEGMVHWRPMVNGYSGVLPNSYLELVSVMQSFPDARSLNYLRGRHVDYVFIRGGTYTAGEWEKLRGELGLSQALELAAAFPPPGSELVFRLKP
jgi:hypothetical protein